jgi:hypothetical protein
METKYGQGSDGFLDAAFTATGQEKRHLKSSGCLWYIPVAIINLLSPWQRVDTSSLNNQSKLKRWAETPPDNTARRVTIKNHLYPNQAPTIYDSRKK